MKHKIIFSTFIFLMHLSLMGQNRILAEYTHTVVTDTVNNSAQETKGSLCIDVNSKTSSYHWDRKNKKYTRGEPQKQDDGSLKVVNKNGNKGLDSTGRVVYKNYGNNFVKVRDILDSWYIISDTVSINWVIKNDVKAFQEMTLQKAECDFRGRHYTAWFNTQIPVSDGPWKLRGLPGLIIEAYDEKEHVKFVLTRLSLLAEFGEDTRKIPNEESISFSEFYEKVAQSNRDLPKKIEAEIIQEGLTVTGLVVCINPIERHK
jgi:GLPGLI family protein